MNEKYLMAVDAGTGSVRAVLFNLAGEQIGAVQKEWTHREDSRYPGSMDFDWVKNWEYACVCIRDVIQETGISSSDISAVGTTSMREGIVLYDKEGHEIWACANVDARSENEVAQLIKQYPDLEKELYRISGQTYALSALPRILWVKNKIPEIYEKATSVSMFNDWLIYKMTGVLSSEPSNSCTTGIYNLERRKWEPPIAAKIGIKESIFPPVQECGTIAGKVSKRGSNETGLAEGTLVVTGGGDAQLGCIGVGVVDNNQAAVFGGSFWQYEYNTNRSSTDDKCRVRVNCHAITGMWQYEAIAFMPGLAMRWFRDAFCQEELEKAKLQGTSAYKLLDEKAKDVPVGCYGMMCTFSDVMNYISWKHAAPTFTNFDFDPQKFSKYTFYRAIMENAALITKGHLELVYEAVDKKPEEIVFAGGASQSSLWCQILADVLNISVKVPVVKEATALGTAILAGFGAGLYSDISKTARDLVKWEHIYVPNPKNNLVYQGIYKNWREVYSAQLSLSDRRVTHHMWSAPGL